MCCILKVGHDDLNLDFLWLYIVQSCPNYILLIFEPRVIKMCQLMYLGVKVCHRLKVGNDVVILEFYGFS